MSDDRLPKQIFYGELANGKRPRHKPKRRFKDCLKDTMKVQDIDYNNWEETAMNRAKWRTEVRKGCKSLHQKKTERAKLKRDLRKGNTENLPSDSACWKCETCGRVLLSKAGYVNHLKSHQRNPRRPSFHHNPTAQLVLYATKFARRYRDSKDTWQCTRIPSSILIPSTL
jgi:hypothetical protein